MEINLFTFVAQMVNFLVLVWLLNKFLYKPVLEAIDKREKKITSQLEDAKEKQVVADKEKDEFRVKNELFDRERKALMDNVMADTSREREKLLEGAREEAGEVRSKLEKALIEIQESLRQDLALKTQREVLSIARMTLNSLASQNLEEQSVKVFISRLKSLITDEMSEFVKTLKSSKEQIIVRSAFDLQEKQQNEIKDVVLEILGIEASFTFIVKPELISGIELTSSGYKLAWNISEFINSFEKNVTETSIDQSATRN